MCPHIYVLTSPPYGPTERVVSSSLTPRVLYIKFLNHCFVEQNFQFISSSNFVHTNIRDFEIEIIFPIEIICSFKFQLHVIRDSLFVVFTPPSLSSVLPSFYCSQAEVFGRSFVHELPIFVILLKVNALSRFVL